MATNLRLERINREDGYLYCVQLQGPDVVLTDGCTLAGKRLNADTIAQDLMLRLAIDPKQRVFVLKNPADARDLDEGRSYEFRAPIA